MSETAIPADAEFVNHAAVRRGGFGDEIHLARFHVSPRRELDMALRALAEKLNADLEFRRLYRGYAWYAVLRLPVA
ncbi:MAG: hypothetical protein Q8J92_03230 [Parvibaculum sp.]|nr:hypothetical protein [Parvibaculum sp.]